MTDAYPSHENRRGKYIGWTLLVALVIAVSIAISLAVQLDHSGATIRPPDPPPCGGLFEECCDDYADDDDLCVLSCERIETPEPGGLFDAEERFADRRPPDC